MLASFASCTARSRWTSVDSLHSCTRSYSNKMFCCNGDLKRKKITWAENVSTRWHVFYSIFAWNTLAFTFKNVTLSNSKRRWLHGGAMGCLTLANFWIPLSAGCVEPVDRLYFLLLGFGGEVALLLSGLNGDPTARAKNLLQKHFRLLRTNNYLSSFSSL